jgi:hypothetical protein
MGDGRSGFGIWDMCWGSGRSDNYCGIHLMAGYIWHDLLNILFTAMDNVFQTIIFATPHFR